MKKQMSIKDYVAYRVRKKKDERKPAASPGKKRKADIVSTVSKPKPTVKKIPIGIDISGKPVVMGLYENHVLVCGQSGSGKSYTTNRIMQEIVQVPMEQRYIAAIDLKGGQELGKWRPCFDAFGIDFEYADLILTNVRHELDRRSRIIWNNPTKYKKSKIEPCADFPLIVVWIDEFAVLANSTSDKDMDKMRQHAKQMVDELLFLGRSVGIVVIICIQRPDSSLLGGFMKNNLKTRLCGRVGAPADTGTVFGAESVNRFPCHELSNFWFYGMLDGQPPVLFKAVGEKDDADLWRTIENPAFHPEEGRGAWLYDKSGGSNFFNADGSPKEDKTAIKGKQEKPVKEPARDWEFVGAEPAAVSEPEPVEPSCDWEFVGVESPAAQESAPVVLDFVPEQEIIDGNIEVLDDEPVEPVEDEFVDDVLDFEDLNIEGVFDDDFFGEEESEEFTEPDRSVPF